MKYDLSRFDHLKTRDLHVHAPYGDPAAGSMEDYVFSAISQGLDEIGFLAPVEAGVHAASPSWLSEKELDLYWEEAKDLRQRYESCIRVSVGLELGLSPGALDSLMGGIGRHPWDRIGLSCHYVADDDNPLSLHSRENAPHSMRRDSLQTTFRYYRDLRDAISTLRPHMVCHLDLIRRQLEDRSNDPKVKALIRQILHEMKWVNAALEVNTSGYDEVGEPYPAGWIIREAAEMGLDLVLGSDSHKPSDVGRYFDSAAIHIHDVLLGSHLTSLPGKWDPGMSAPSEQANF